MTLLLKINLTESTVEKEDISSLEEEYLGGVGVNTRLLVDMVALGADPLGEDNVLLFGVGSLVGTMLPTASRCEVTAKSPLSGRFGTSNGGGFFGAALRFAGVSYLSFQGCASSPVMLVIANGKVSIKEAEHLWGKDVWETTDWIRENLGTDYRVATIGTAGENLVRYASIQNDYYASWGRTGMGAVMGSKNLKAIAVKGSGRVEVADAAAFAAIKKEAFRRVKEEGSFGFIRRYGSMVVSDPSNSSGSLPGRNFTTGYFPDWEETRGRKVFEQKYKERDMACFACPIACIHWSKVKEEGPHQGLQTRGLEVAFVLEFGAKLDIKSIPEIFRCVEICNNAGMDVISAAGSIAFLIEAFEKELAEEKDIGFVPAFGDYKGISRLLKMIARREGVGDLLAAGVKVAATRLPDTEALAMQVKGVEMPVKDPRAKLDVFTFGYLTSTRGGDSLRTRSPVEALLKGLKDARTEELGVSPEHIAALDMPENLKKEIFGDPPTGVNIPRMSVYAENLITIINSVGFCIRPPVLRSLGPDFYARALKAVTGRNYDAAKVYAAGNKIWQLQHDFNRQEGETPSEYSFPERFYKESISGQKGEILPLSREKVEENVREYFLARGWAEEWR